MRDTEPWLSQGDLFREIPIIETAAPGGAIQASIEHGPTMLCTHDCELDKATRSGQSNLKTIQFAPLRSVEFLNEGQRASLPSWQGELNPARLFHMGPVEDLGDVFCDLGEIYALPAEYFSPELRQSAVGAPQSLVATRNDTRLCRIDQDQLDLLKRKLMAFWTRTIPDAGASST